MEHDAERAESLISEAENKGNEEALLLVELINDLKGKNNIDLRGLYCVHWKKMEDSFDVCHSTNRGRIDDWESLPFDEHPFMEWNQSGM